MRTKIALIAALALGACAHEEEPEAVEPTTTSTSGGMLDTGPQASAPAPTPSAAIVPAEERSMEQQYGTYEDPSASLAPSEEDPVPANAALHARVHEALREDARIDPTTIAVSVNGNVVFLGGYVGSDEQVRFAQETVSQVPGVEQVFTHALRVRS